MVRIRVKPIESGGSYRVNKIAWSEKVHRVASAKSGEMGARFGLEGWPEKWRTGIFEKLSFRAAGQSRQRRLQRGPRLPCSLCLFYSTSPIPRPLTDELLHVGLGWGLERAPVIQDASHFPPHAALASNMACLTCCLSRPRRSQKRLQEGCSKSQILRRAEDTHLSL